MTERVVAELVAMRELVEGAARAGDGEPNVPLSRPSCT